MHRFKDLEIWKQSRILCSEIYLITKDFPEQEKFGLTNQLRRASVSIPSNIAEGSARNTNKDFCRFLDIALGSAYEVETQLLIAGDLNFISEEKTEITTNQLHIIIKMITRFKTILNNKTTA
ncbi:MAG TPA: four helix bundle protein [Flavobacterium sp.]|nr:four helix bundle protein [Flavobacterium sp.]